MDSRPDGIYVVRVQSRAIVLVFFRSELIEAVEPGQQFRDVQRMRKVCAGCINELRLIEPFGPVLPVRLPVRWEI